jgi:hypothetical protein
MFERQRRSWKIAQGLAEKRRGRSIKVENRVPERLSTNPGRCKMMGVAAIPTPNAAKPDTMCMSNISAYGEPILACRLISASSFHENVSRKGYSQSGFADVIWTNEPSL